MAEELVAGTISAVHLLKTWRDKARASRRETSLSIDKDIYADLREYSPEAIVELPDGRVIPGLLTCLRDGYFTFSWMTEEGIEDLEGYTNDEVPIFSAEDGKPMTQELFDQIQTALLSGNSHLGV